MSAASLATIVAVAFFAFLFTGIHRVEEGHVGVYWFAGALLDSITEPGYHFKSPLTSFRNIQTTMQTDQVKNIPCGTSGGVMLTFGKIEVVNRLRKELVHETIKNYTVEYDKTWIYDKIHHEINQFCSAHTLQEIFIEKFDQIDEELEKALQDVCNVWAPGIQIIAIRVTKPIIPEVIRRGYEDMEAENTKLLIAEQTQRVVEREAETDLKRAVIEAEKVLDVAVIDSERKVKKKEGLKKLAHIEDEMHLSRKKADADAEFYKAEKEAQSNAALFSDAYRATKYIDAVSQNSQIIFGDRVPKTLLMNPDGSATAVASEEAASTSTRTKGKSA